MGVPLGIQRRTQDQAAKYGFRARAEAGLWDQLADRHFPETLQWEMLVDVLRGRVKVSEMRSHVEYFI